MNKEIIYTESATKKIEIVVEDFKKRIEIDIVNSKYYFGEDNIEITASDIEDSYKRVQIVKNTKKTTEVRKKIFLAYFILGVFTLFFGLFYDQMQYLAGDYVDFVDLRAKEDKKDKKTFRSDQKLKDDYRKRYASYKPQSPEQYQKDIGKTIATILPAWITYRNTINEIKLTEEKAA